MTAQTQESYNFIVHTKQSTTNKGAIELVLIVIVLAFALVLTGIIATPIFSPAKEFPALITTETTKPAGTTTPTSNNFCCDTGDGDACQVKTDADNSLTYNGQAYGLLKSNIHLVEGPYHLQKTNETYKGKPIVINTSDSYPQRHRVCSDSNGIDKKDEIVKKGGCFAIPDEQLIYVCKKNCTETTTSTTGVSCDEFPGLTCFGNHTTLYDVYFRKSDIAAGIHNDIKNCDKNAIASIDFFDAKKLAPADKPAEESSAGQIVIIPTQGAAKQNLQMQSLKIINLIQPGGGGTVPEGATAWMSPYCKPAIYLYPEKTMNVHVKVTPQGNMTLTIPLYPKDGWRVVATPDGTISGYNNTYDYLYYEAEIPDTLVEKPREGYVVSYQEIKHTLQTLLPRLGLNEKETKQFVDYWIAVLPQSPFYAMGVVNPANLDVIAPLTITPKPNTIIRVSLYFEPLEKAETRTMPPITPVSRDGFTVVEWGGLFKRSDKYHFSCFM